MNGKNWEETSWSNGVIQVKIQEILDFLKYKDIEHVQVFTLKDLSLHKNKQDAKTLENIEKADLNFPILILKHSDKSYQILDGHHRLQKAINHNLLTVKAKIILFDDMPDSWKDLFQP